MTTRLPPVTPPATPPTTPPPPPHTLLPPPTPHPTHPSYWTQTTSQSKNFYPKGEDKVVGS